MRKLLAILLSAVMLMPEVYAEPLVHNNVSSENEGTEIIDGGVITEDPIDEVVTDTEEDETPVTEDSEKDIPVATIPAEETSDETVTEEQNTPVMLADEGVQSRTIPTIPSLTLDEAKEYTVTNETGLVHVLSVNGNTISVDGGSGLILLSNVYPSEYKDKKLELKSTVTGFNTTESQLFSNEKTYSFLGLGNSESPYSGCLEFVEGSGGFSIVATRALFSYISTDASLPSNINFMMVGNNSGQIVLADIVIKGNTSGPLSVGVSLTVSTSSSSSTSDTIGGLIDTIKSEASVNINLTNNMTGALSVSGDANRGLFCNTMENNSFLSATLISSGTVNVISNNGNAGGFVGEMKGDNTLYVSGKSVTSVKATSGNAGGLVGKADNPTINVNSESAFSLSNITVIAGTEGNSGGLIGELSTGNGSLDLSKYILNTMLSGGKNSGGVFGLLNNSGNYSISGGSVSSELTSGINYGGLIGSYSASQLGNSLIISNIEGEKKISSKGGEKATDYGGIIGKVSGSSYVEIKNVTLATPEMTSTSTSNFGGLIGEMENGMLNIGSVALSGSPKASGTIGGIVGYLQKGVIRLYGTTDISEMTINSLGSGSGQIVGKNNTGLVYAVGNGNSVQESSDNPGWLLKRDKLNSASDIGNWGQVIRLDGSKLKETTDASVTSAPNLFYFNSTEHYIKVLGDPGSTYTIGSVRDFAAYALTYDFGGNDQNCLKFSGTNKTDVKPNKSQTITISSNIDLTGTGILGIGRDDGNGTNGGGGADNNYFMGSISGTSNDITITLDIGKSAFGHEVDQNGDSSGKGGLQIYGDAHNFLALLPVAGGNTNVNNLIINGNVVGYNHYNSNNTGRRIAGVIGYCRANPISFTNVTVSANINISGDASWVYQSGFFGDSVDKSQTIQYTNCKWEGTLENGISFDQDRYSRIGGFAAYIQKGTKSITVTDCIISGEIIASSATTVYAGGLIAVFQDGQTDTSLKLINLQINRMSLSATSATGTSGGLLGHSWPDTNVTFGNETKGGVTVSDSSLVVNTAKFGGLVYQATGYWNATASNSIRFNASNTITGGTDQSSPSGLLVGTGLITSGNQKKALYLEVGTWGENKAYYISPGAVALTLNNSVATAASYFDELVGTTIRDVAGNENAVVSLATENDNLIDNNESTCNTYSGQIYNFKNDESRYYYNLDKYRNKGSNDLSSLTSESLSSSSAVLSWSVSQYAAGNIRHYFCMKSGKPASISGSLDLKGYSYYPVTPLSNVTVGNSSNDTTLSFAYEEMNNLESGNKPFNNNNQHYLMHYGLFYNVVSDLTVQRTILSGNVGKSSNDSGALIYNEAKGNLLSTPKIIPKLTFSYITLNGLRVSDVASNTNYAPLLINKIGSGVNLSITELSTGTGYVNDNNTIYAASSLIGNVGSSSATSITLVFSKIALDSQISARNDNTTSVKNNGNVNVEYNTTHTIFTKATLLNWFKYSTDSSGIYNFYKADSKVTFGVETSKSFQNLEEQYEYFDNDGGFIYDGLKDQPNEKTASYYFTSDTYLPYVAEWNKTLDNRHELNVNKKPINLLQGCGTYGDPYLIENGKQLTALANYLNPSTASSVNGLTVVFNTDVNSAQNGSTAFHTREQVTQDGSTINDAEFIWNTTNNNWIINTGEGNETISADNARTYLLNAYYKIEKSIVIKNGDYAGLGTEEYPFSGVIVGDGTNDNTVNIAVKNQNVLNFGGLIRFSQGSVVKNLTLNYTNASIKLVNNAVPSGINNPFFGGIVGYCMGGDTIVDNVTVTYSNNSITLDGSNNYDHLIAVGGYVGLVGGAKNSSGIEVSGGGLIFRNMAGRENPFTVGDLLNHSSEDSKYFYCNPFVGRVLDGYVLYDGGNDGNSTLNNTNKNYTIPDIISGKNDLKVTKNSDDSFSVKITSAKGLWLLSSIVNSGAGAMDESSSVYSHQYGGTNGATIEINAYNLGKPRTASYDKIGNIANDSDLVDECFWGGVSSTSPDRVSFLVKNYTFGDENGRLHASRIAGGNSLPMITLSFPEGTIDLSSYGNGFRGIGSSYAKGMRTWSDNNNAMQGRYILIKEINPAVQDHTRVNTNIKLGIDQQDYCNNYYNNGWFAQGVGLFMGFVFSNGCTVNNITLSGTSKLILYDNDGSRVSFKKTGTYENYGEVPVGAFANRTANSSGSLIFNNLRLEDLSVYGGHHAAGVIGMVERTGGQKNITFNNWYIGKNSNGQKTKIGKKTYNDGSSAGLLGWCYSSNTTDGNSPIITLNGVGLDSEKWNVDGVCVSADTFSKSSATSCGLIGACDGYQVEIIGVRANNIEVSGSNMRECGGLADGGGFFSLEKCWVEDLKITATGSGQVGGLLGKAYSTTISNCHIVGTQDNLIKIQGNNYAGGLLGVSTGSNTIIDCELINTNVLANGENAGGLIGQINGDTNSVSNTSFSNVKVVTQKNNKSAGLITGHTNGKSINGYNLLAESCSVGYNTTATIDNLGTIISTGTYNGLWLGCSKDKDNKLVAVAIKGENQPQKNVGKIESGSVQVTYADYCTVQTNTLNSASPYVDVNPMIKTSGLSMTGNGIGYCSVNKASTDENGNPITTPVTQSIAKTILEEARTNSTTRKYWNVKDESETSNTFSQLLDNNANAYITDYFEEEQEGKDSPVTSDFPILVINNIGSSTDADTPIWNYIAALTNVSSATEAKKQVSSITATTYKVDSVFTAQSTSSLNVSGTTISIRDKDTYDNQKNQFTLLDVKYNDPTGSNGNGFHLYVPILVKKVMNARFSVKMLSGTNYRKEAYSVSNYATAGFEEPITAYMEYNYERTKSEWEAMLNSGENLLWNYDKILDLAKDKISALPDHTKLVLVDRQTKKTYYHEFSSSDNLHMFNLSTMTLDGTQKSESFAPVPVCDLLGLTIDESVVSEKLSYISLGSMQTGATVKVGNTYYRPATDEELNNDGIKKYTISINTSFIDNNSTSYLEQGEGYYLTIQIPNADTVINHPLSYSMENMTATDAPVAAIKKTTESEKNYVIYDGIQQTDFTIRTSKNSNSTDSVMSDGDSIQVSLTSTLKLTNSGIANFVNYYPTELDHQFNINLKKYLKAESGDTVSDVLIGAEGARYTYTVTKADGTELLSRNGTFNNSESMEKLSIDCGSENAKEIVQYFTEHPNGSLSIQAIITLPYPTIGSFFPGRDQSDTTSGISVAADSRVATATTQLPITQNKKTIEDKTRYYTQNPSEATLIYNTYDDGTGDDTRKLGVNPSDTTNDLSRTIYTSAVYNYANVDPSILSNAHSIKYSMQLFQKQEDGSYGNALEKIDEYLPSVTEMGLADGQGINTLIKTKVFTQDVTKSDTLNIQITPLTGDAFEEKEFTYSNYKVVLTAVLLDSKGNELAGTKASDYIVYTNARIYQRIIDATN